MIPLTFCRAADPLAAATQRNTTRTMLDSRCGVLGVKGLTFFPPEQIAAHCGKNRKFFVSSYHKVFLQKVFFFFLSMWSAANFSRALRRSSFSANVYAKHIWLWTLDTCLTAASNSLWTSRKMVFDSKPFWPVFFQQQVIVCIFFLIMAVTQLWQALKTYSCLHSWSWYLCLLWF